MDAIGREDRILVVEDQPVFAREIEQQLTSHGFKVATTQTGAEALKRFSDEFDMVVLDWMLPDMSGLTVLSRLREHSALPVLMVTARSDEMDRVTGLERGADDYLVKPFGKHELVARTRALLRRSRITQSHLIEDKQTRVDVCSHQGLTLDMTWNMALLNDNEIHLTRLEFGLLHLFLSHPQRVFSRDYLLEALWDGAAFGCDRSVDNAVLRLRKKLTDWKGAIDTVWGVGYRLAPPPSDS